MENRNETLVVSVDAKEYLQESAKWSKILAIIGFVGIGIMVVVAFFMGIIATFVSPEVSAMRSFPSGIFTILYLLMAGIYYLPVYYLYKYATDTKKALVSNDSELLEAGLEKLKSHHKFLGIMMLVLLSIYALLFVIAIFAGIFAAANY